MQVFISESGVVSTTIRMFENDSGVDIRNRVDDLRAVRKFYETEGGLKSRLVLFLNSDTATAIDIRMGAHFSEEDIQSFENIRDLIGEISKNHDVNFVHQHKVYRLP